MSGLSPHEPTEPVSSRSSSVPIDPARSSSVPTLDASFFDAHEGRARLPASAGPGKNDRIPPPFPPIPSLAEVALPGRPPVIRAEGSIYRADLFEKCREPWVFNGREDAGSLIYYGGLSATGYAWRDLAAKVFERSAFRTEVHTLAGHTGRWADLKAVTHEQWVSDIVAKASQARNPIFLGYSTSALAAIVAAGRHPELFKGLVLVAPPLKIRGQGRRFALNWAEFCHRRFPRQFRWLEDVRFNLGDNGRRRTRQNHRNPSFEEVPLTALMGVRRLQREAMRVLPKLKIPVLVMQGHLDRLVAPDVPSMFQRTMRGGNLTVRLFNQSPHGIMLGPEKKEVLKTVTSWLRDTCIPSFVADKERIPDFVTRRTREAVVRDIMGYIPQLPAFLDAVPLVAREGESPS